MNQVYRRSNELIFQLTNPTNHLKLRGRHAMRKTKSPRTLHPPKNFHWCLYRGKEVPYQAFLYSSNSHISQSTVLMQREKQLPKQSTKSEFHTLHFTNFSKHE